MIGRKGSHGKVQHSWDSVFAIDTTFYVDSTLTDADIRWLFYALQALRLDELGQDVGVPGLNREDAYRQRLPVPPKSDQRAIAAFLDAETAHIDALVSKKRRLIELVGQRWLAAVRHRLRVPDFPDSSANPWARELLSGGWRVLSLRHLLSDVWGGDWGSEVAEGERGTPCVRSADFDFARLQATDAPLRSFNRSTLQRRLLQPGDMILEKSGGGDEAPVGRVVAWRGEGAAVPTNFAGGLRASRTADPDFVLLVFRCAYELGLPWRSIKQTTGLQNLDVGHYLSHRWAVPPLEEQGRIARDLMAKLEAVRVLQTRLDKQVGLLLEHRRAVIEAAVAGDLKVPGVAA